MGWEGCWSKVRLVNFGDLGELVGEGTVPIGEIKENIRRQAGLLRVQDEAIGLNL